LNSFGLTNSAVARSLAGLLLGLSSGATASGHPKLFVQATQHIEVLYYSPAHEYLVTHLIRSYENALQFQQRLFRYTPSDRLTVLIDDFADPGHGGAGTVPRNFIGIGIAPYDYTYETIPANERITWIINHESTHIVMLDEANATDRRWRRIFFGKVVPNAEDPESMLYGWLTTPRRYAPRWYHEGIATFMETWMAGGLGRALGGWDEMVFRGMVRDDAYIYDVVGLESEGTAIDFQTGANSYLYGTRFMTWVSTKYGPEKFVEWISRSDRTAAYFAARFKQVYGIPLAKAWRDWIGDERLWQEKNLAEIRKYPVTVPQHISKNTIGSVSRSFYDADAKVLYAAIRYPGKMGHIAVIHTDDGHIEHLRDIKGAAPYYVASLAYSPQDHQLFYSTDNNDWRDLNVYDIKTKRSRRLLTGCRAGDLVFDQTSKALWGIRHANGLSEIVRFDPPYQKMKRVFELKYANDIFDIDISPDGKYMTAALADASGRQKLVRFETAKLMAEDASYEVLYDFEYNSPGNFVYSPDGKYLYGSSYYTGASNLFRYDFERKKMDVISNAETGLFRPVPLPDGSLIAYEYTAKGFVPSRLPTKPLEDVSSIKYFGMALLDKYSTLKEWKLPPPSSIHAEDLITKAGEYKPAQNMHLVSIYPVVEGYKSTASAGMRFNWADSLGLSGITLVTGYSPSSTLGTNEQFHGTLDAHYWNWELKAAYNYADFYDLFGPTKVSRRGTSVKISHSNMLISDVQRTLKFDWGVAGYAGIDELPDYQNVVAPYHSFFSANSSLNYSFLERSQGAVDDEKGTQWSIRTRLNYAVSGVFPRIYGTYDKGFLLAKHNSVWLRAAAGKSWGEQSDPFANFYFGDFGNNYVDHGEISRYRDYYSFPGYGLDALSATSFGKLLGEYNLPAVHFRRAGATWMYVNWARLTFFSGELLTNFANSSTRNEYTTAGAQLDFRIVFFTYFNTTLSGGFGAATDWNGHPATQGMISLKIL
jgi:hypothetical protein